MARTLRTRFARDIVAEFLPPARRSKRARAIIICDGAPSIPSKSTLVGFLAKKGFWVFYPRYRGTWESGGIFLRKSPEQDVLDVIGTLPKGFTDAWGGKKFTLKPDEIFIIAASFGGPAGILASRDPRVKKVVAVSPVIDWRAPSKLEPLEFMEKFVHNAFGSGYRFGKKEWAKLRTGKFYNPAHHADEIDGSKLLIFHAKDDGSVRWNEVAKFARKTKADIKLSKKGGHLGAARIVESHWPQILRFFNNA